ncbi:MAG: Ig-like domain-containing protein [Deltaproteobacteria bacterium]|nr:Ig-like domain-containing protein [Deltaproteobacteria bacterium]
MHIEGTPITRIEISPKKDQFEVGQEIGFQATGVDAYGNSRTIEPKWSLSGQNALLKEEGVVKMASSGQAILVARFKEIKQGHPFSIVPGQVAKIIIKPKQVDLKAGESLTFESEVFNAQGHLLKAPIQWNIDGHIGTITQEGTFLAKTVGEGRVLAISGEAGTSVPVQVAHGALVDMMINMEKKTLTAGEKVTLNAQGLDAYGNQFPVSPEWFLSASIGKIDQSASTFMPLHVGRGQILAKINKVVQGVDVNVVPAELARLTINPPAVDIIAGRSVQFEVTGYDPYGNEVEVTPNFSILEPLGEISPSGKLSARHSGSTMIQAEAKGLLGESTVAVLPAEMKKVDLSPRGPVKATAGKAVQFEASGYDAYGNTTDTEVSWDMHPDLGSVDAQGLFYPKQSGKARLTATLHQRRTEKKMEITAEVHVVPGEAVKILVTPDSAEITAGAERVFSATAYDQFQNKTAVDLGWTVEPTELGSITQKGQFAAIRAGSGTVNARHNRVVGSASVKVEPARVAFLKIIPEEVAAQAGTSIDLKAVMEDRFGNVVKGDITWDLSDKTLADIRDNRVLIAKKAGKGQLIAAAYNIVATVPLTVKRGPLHAIEVTPTAKTVRSGSTVPFEATGFDAGGNRISDDFHWSVDDAIGRIDPAGQFTAIQVGSGKVAVRSGDIEANAAVTVTPGPPANIVLQPKSFTITAGEMQRLVVEVRDDHGNLIQAPELSWAVTDELGTLMDQDRFKARMAGQGEIRLRAGDVTVQSTVTVEPGPIHTVTIEPTSVQMRAGDVRDFVANGFDSQGNPLELPPVWTTSGDVGTFNEEGHFKATSTGSGFVTARMKNAIAVAQVKVSPGPVDRLALTPSTLELKAGSGAGFSAVAYDAYGNMTPADITWSLSAQKSIGKMTDDGYFEARHAGKGVVVATAAEVKGQARVRVLPNELKHIVGLPESISLRSGETVQLHAIGKDAYGNTREIEPDFVLTPTVMGTIDSAGRLTAFKVGSGQLRVSIDGVTTKVPVNVEPGPLASLKIRFPEKTLRAGNTYPFEVVGYDPGGNQVSVQADWSVSQDIGRIERKTGMFYALKAGSGLVLAATNGIATHKSVMVEPGKLYSLFIEPNPVTVASNTIQAFEVSGMDVEKNPVAVSEAAVEWDVTGGIGAFETSGRFRGTQMGKGKVVARSGDLLAEAYVSVVPGEPDPQNARVRVTYPTLPADGKSFSEIIVEVRDRYSNPVPGVQVTVVSNRQADEVIQPGKTNKQGVARGRIRSDETGRSIIQAVVGGNPFMDRARIQFE